MQVKVDPTAAQAVTDTKSLSGGERSFMNMCFIMAVGKDISSPFHCLDEFDVRPLWLRPNCRVPGAAALTAVRGCAGFHGLVQPQSAPPSPAQSRVPCGSPRGGVLTRPLLWCRRR